MRFDEEVGWALRGGDGNVTDGVKADSTREQWHRDRWEALVEALTTAEAERDRYKAALERIARWEDSPLAVAQAALALARNGSSATEDATE